MIDSLDLRTLQKESARALIVMQNADNLSLSEINQKVSHDSTIFYKKVLAPIRGEWSLILKQKHKTIYALYGLFKNFDHGTNKLLNDYNINFIPITERLNLNFSKIKIDGIERSQSRYLDKFMNNL